MSLYSVTLISAISIVVPFIVSLFCLRRMRPKYSPLVVLLIAGVINESFSISSCFLHLHNSINGNIYSLFDFLTTVWLFQKLDSGLSKKFLLSVLIFGILIWITDNLIVNSLYSNNSLFRMVASFLIVFLSIDKINQNYFAGGLIAISQTDLMLSAGFLSYYAYKSFVEAFHFFPIHPDKSFYIILWIILGIVNLIVNLVFTAAILCIRPTNQYSIRL